MNNVFNIVYNNELCVFCGTCVSICPEKCLQIEFKEEYKLFIDKDNCSNCGECIYVCPGLNIKNAEKENSEQYNYYIGNYIKLLKVFSTNFLSRYNSSSGGFVSELVKYLLSKKIVDGAVLTFFNEKQSVKPEAVIIDNPSLVENSRGSKYSPVPLNTVLSDLNEDKKYAIVALPCHVQGLIKFIERKHSKIKRENLIIISLFCSRTNKLNATKQLLKLSGFNEINDISSILYRGRGRPGKFLIKLKDGKSIEVQHLSDQYWGHLFKNYYMPYRCWLCPDKTGFFSDISVSDDWTESLNEDIVGKNNVVLRNDEVLKIVRDMEAEKIISCEPLDLEKLVASQGLNYKMNIRQRLKLASTFRKSVPSYSGFHFKLEAQSFSRELFMFLRIFFENNPFYDIYVRFKINSILPMSKLLKNIFLIGKLPIKATVRKLYKIFLNTFSSPWFKINGKYILTIGGYGYNDVGDEAMPKAIIENLLDASGARIDFIMLSPKPDFTSEYHNKRSFYDVSFFSSQNDIQSMNIEFNELFEIAEIYKRSKLRAFIKCATIDRMNYFQVIHLIENCLAVLNVGGGNLNSIMRKELYKRCIIHKIASQVFNKPCYISGQTVGPLYCDNDMAVIKDSFQSVKVMTFRDKDHSIKIIRDELGLGNIEMYDAGDDAFTLKSVEESVAEKLIRFEVRDFRKDNSPWVAMNMKASLNSFKGAGRSTGLGKEIEILVRAADYLVDRYNAKVILVPTDYCDGVDDRVVHAQILSEVRETSRDSLFSLNKVYSDKELKGIISCFDIAIGVRYHFSVFSLAEAVPTIGLASGEYQMAKLRGIYRLLDVKEFFIDEDMEDVNFQIIKEKIDDLFLEKEKIAVKLKMNSKIIEKSSKLIVEKILNDMSLR